MSSFDEEYHKNIIELLMKNVHRLTLAATSFCDKVSTEHSQFKQSIS